MPPPDVGIRTPSPIHSVPIQYDPPPGPPPQPLPMQQGDPTQARNAMRAQGSRAAMLLHDRFNATRGAPPGDAAGANAPEPTEPTPPAVQPHQADMPPAYSELPPALGEEAHALAQELGTSQPAQRRGLLDRMMAFLDKLTNPLERLINHHTEQLMNLPGVRKLIDKLKALDQAPHEREKELQQRIDKLSKEIMDAFSQFAELSKRGNQIAVAAI